MQHCTKCKQWNKNCIDFRAFTLYPDDIYSTHTRIKLFKPCESFGQIQFQMVCETDTAYTLNWQIPMRLLGRAAEPPLRTHTHTPSHTSFARHLKINNNKAHSPPKRPHASFIATQTTNIAQHNFFFACINQRTTENCFASKMVLHSFCFRVATT